MSCLLRSLHFRASLLENPILSIHVYVPIKNGVMYMYCRSMLYNGSEVIRDVEWVIFDEVHYINDSEVILNTQINRPDQK